jgi:hypothetical protein
LILGASGHARRDPASSRWRRMAEDRRRVTLEPGPSSDPGMRHSVLIALLVGCGGGDGGDPTRAITAEEARPLCEATCQHRIVDCGQLGDDLASCTAECVDESAGLFRRDAFEAFYECAAALPCEESDDPCLRFVEPLPIHLEWEAACRTNLAACNDFEPAFCDIASDETGVVRLLAPDIVSELIACLDGSGCEPQLDCLSAVFEAHGQS